MKHIKIAFVTAGDENAGSTRQRVYKMSKELQRRGYCVSINQHLKQADVLIFQKSDYGSLRKRFFKYLRSNKFIVFDVDDMYVGDYLKLVKYSDLVIAGSQYLADFYAQYNENIAVLDDALDVIDENIPLKQNINLKNPQIGWFGTATNLPILEKLQIKGLKTITRGGDIEWSRETVDFNIQKFDLMCIPQEKTPVGLSKGNCRMLKTMYLGVPALVSDIPPYIELANLINYPKGMLVTENEDWNQKIEKIKSGEIHFNFDFEQARKKILANYSIQARTDLWLKIIEQSYKKLNIVKHVKKLLFSSKPK